MKHYELYKDEELVNMYRDGDARAVDEIMERYKNLVRKKANAMYIVGGDKDDLIQEGMIGLYKAVTTYDELKAASFATFAVKASNAKKNTPLNSYVSFDTPANKSDDESDMKLVDTLVHDSEQNPEALYIDREVTDNLEEKAFESLSPFEKQVVTLLMEGNDYIKIADQLGKTPKSIDNAIQRSRNKIKIIVD